MQEAEHNLNLQGIPRTPGIYKFFSNSSIFMLAKQKILKVEFHLILEIV